MRNTWGIESLDGIQKPLVSESPCGISILSTLFLHCFSCLNLLFVCTYFALHKISVNE